MSFLQPALLAALPLIALPIIIHLINQRRYQTVQWAAMMFLLAANRMSRGYARLRRWLIMLFRVLAVAALVFTVSRPLASGWLGLAAGGRADTTIILLDRSPSMQQQGPGVVVSKLETGREQLVRTLNTLSSTRWLLIENNSNEPRELESPDALLNPPASEPSSASADVPAMLEAAQNYIQSNQTGRTEIWICSDLREDDWQSESSRWNTLRDGFSEMNQGVRFHLLAYPQAAPANIAIRVTEVRQRQSIDGSELLISLLLTRDGNATETATVPLQFEIEGARSELTVDLSGPQFELKDHRIAIESGRERGWGRVSIPADANPADNDFYFVFDQPPPRRTIVVADDPQAARPLQLAAGISPAPTIECVADIVPIEQLNVAEWDQAGLLLWQAPLPAGDTAQLVESFVNRGGRVIFFPPRVPSGDAFYGVKWGSWVETSDDVAIDTWRSDQDLLERTQNGAALPVGQLRVAKYCEVSGEYTQLASLSGGAPVLARVRQDDRGVYFCATTPAPKDSSLATDGVVLYVAVQRALADGAAVLRDTQQLVAGGPIPNLPTSWSRLSGPDEGLSTEYRFHRGAYHAGDRLLAVNRAAGEDEAVMLEEPQVAELFQGLDFALVTDRAGNMQSLIQEIWRLFLGTMLVAMVVEAALCLPKQRRSNGAGS